MLLIAVVAAAAAIGRAPAPVMPFHVWSGPTVSAPVAQKSKPKPDLPRERPQVQCRVSANQAGVGIFYLYGEIEPGPALACGPPPENVALPPPLPF